MLKYKEEDITDIIEHNAEDERVSINPPLTDGTCKPNKFEQYYKYAGLVAGDIAVNTTQVSVTATIDDITCFADYFQNDIDERTVGVYKLPMAQIILMGIKTNQEWNVPQKE